MLLLKCVSAILNQCCHAKRIPGPALLKFVEIKVCFRFLVIQNHGHTRRRVEED